VFPLREQIEVFLMAGNGRRSKKLAQPVLTTDGDLRGPELPDGPTVLPREQEWHPLILKMWEDLRRSPQAQRMGTDLDWDAALLTMIIADQALKTGKWATAAPEVRMRMNQFGDTPAARNSLKFDTPGADDLAAGVTSGSNIVDFSEMQRRRRRAVG